VNLIALSTRFPIASNSRLGSPAILADAPLSSFSENETPWRALL
jgi:hypothetical protein